MNVLSGRTSDSSLKLSGLIQFDGERFDLTKVDFRPAVGFVPQQDVLLPTQTAKEALEFACKLQRPSKESQKQKDQKVRQLLWKLGLRKCKNTYVGDAAARLPGLSGGEKRRVSVGVELVSDPQLLICDEVTTGLDSHMALSVMKMLRAIANSGCSVITTIHQPSSQIYGLFIFFLNP